jgi:hypothetical protein
VLPPLLAGAWFYSSVFWALAVSLGTVLVLEASLQVVLFIHDRG